MLPYFHIRDNNKDMFMQEIPQKPKRKSKPDVPIHKSDRLEKRGSVEKTYKTYSANFSGKKNKHSDAFENAEEHNGHFEDPDEKLNAKLSRKYLSKENEKLVLENKDLSEKLQALEDYLNKKNCKLKDKLNSFESLNAQISGENVALRLQCEQLEAQFITAQVEIQKLQICKNCEHLSCNLEQSKSENLAQKKNNQELKEDVGMLKNVVYRLNVQLERYQEKLSKHNIRINSIKSNQARRVDTTENLQTVSNEEIIRKTLPESHWDHSHSPISWGKVNSHTLGPLLDAYQEAISEKEDIIQDYEAELAKFTTRMKDVIKENELLHKRLNEDTGCSKMLNKQIEGLTSDLKTTKDQNDLLIKKCALKQDKIEEILKCYETKLEQTKRDYTVLHDQYCKSRNEVIALKEKNKNLLEVHDDFKSERQAYIPVSVHKSSVDECKKWYEELKGQYDVEKAKLSENIDDLSKQLKEINEKVGLLNKEKVELENKIKNHEKHLKKSEVKYLDLQHTLNEVQLSRSACRKQLHKAMNFAKDLVAEQESLLKALNQRHLENKAVKKLGSDIASRMDSLKTQLKLVQKDAWEELSTVEQRLQDQNAVIATMKQEHNQEIERLKQIIKSKDDSLLKETGSSIPMPHYLLYKDKHCHFDQ